MRHRAIKILTVMLFPVLALAACNQHGNKPSNHSIISFFQQKMDRYSEPGAALVRKRCASCHFLDRNLTKVGPSLKGIFGRAPSISGVPFKIWDETSLNLWIKNPTGIKPDTLMTTPGIKSARERAEIIAYLKQL